MTRAALVTALAALAALAFAIPAEAAFPGANGKIAYGLGVGLWTMSQDGSSQASIGTGNSPSYSQDGSKIAVASSGSIWTMKDDGTNQVMLPGSSFEDRDPAWSPDGQKIAYVESTEDAADIDVYVMNADGTARHRITTDYDPTFTTCVPPFAAGESSPPPCPEHREPAWSPDGNTIAFDYIGWGLDEACFCWQRNAQRIDVVHPDGSGRATVTPGTAAKWSPDGGRLVFQYGSDLAIANADGTGLAQIPNTLGGAEPAWSPDGKKIAFEFANGIASINPDGTGRTQLATSAGLPDTTPDWQPLHAFDRYPRPGGGTPYRVPLVTAFRVCGGPQSPNSTHVAPLSLPSCTPPVLESNQLTTGTVGGAQGSALLKVIPGNPATTADEADVQVSASTSDVRSRPSGSDYAGSLILTTALRITDRQNGFGDVAGTAADTSFSAPFSCVTTPSGGLGSNCSFATTADTLVPGVIAEGKRAVWSILQLRVRDAGPDGDVGPPASCPPTCGTGDEQTFLDQGVFAP